MAIILGDPGNAAARFLLPFVARRLLGRLNIIVAAACAISPADSAAPQSMQGVPRELDPMIKAFNAALDRIETGRARKARFLANVAHELRTPVAILRTRIDALPRDGITAKLEEDLERLARVANS